jgi:tRNA isopentenyl-2-thiomethyl-A-37 hydroxylase MiaE
MNSRTKKFNFIVLLLGIGSLLLFPAIGRSHCDTLDGPIIVDAKIALAKADITPVLKWVKQASEAELKILFDHTLKVRALGEEAKYLADMYFFETLVRLHRAGEGFPYNGLLPAGFPLPIALVEADYALKSGSLENLTKLLTEDLHHALHLRFEKVLEAKKHKDESVQAGREFVEAYVQYVHFAEELGNLISGHHMMEEKPAEERLH